MVTKRRRTKQRGVYSIKHEDGTRTYIATWKEERPLNVTDPLATFTRTVEEEAATFDQACLLQAEGEAAERRRQGRPPEGIIERLGNRMMAMKFFEYRGRR